MKFVFIEQHASTWPVAGERHVPHALRVAQRLLRLAGLGIERANDGEPCAARRLEARQQGRYWSPWMHAALRAEGRQCNRGRVERLMHRHRIRALAGRRF